MEVFSLILQQSLLLHQDNFNLNSLPNDKFLNWSKIKAFADDQSNVDEKIEISFGKGRKHCGKRMKCWLSAFYPFPTMVSNGFYFKVVCDCVVKSFKTLYPRLVTNRSEDV